MTGHDRFTTEPSEASNRLRRLQEHSRSNLPATILQGATSTFTLHEEPMPAVANEYVLVTVYPQDPFVGEPEVRTMSKSDIGDSLLNSRVRVQDSQGDPAEPDSDGNYLYWPGSPQFDQVNAFYYTTFTLRMYERYARRALPWSFPQPRITVDPHYGDQPNAFYSEQERLLGFHSFEFDGEVIGTAWSADIVSHEAGHAVMDGLRDLYNESFSLGPNALHESFGDITAMLVALHDDSLVRRLLDWTKGDLRLDNFVTVLAEQLTDALMRLDTTYLRGRSAYLRNALNGFRKVPFDELVFNPLEPEFQLGRQPHNYSRLFTGAFYDILAGIYERLNLEMPAHIAIYRARDIASYMLVFALEAGPVGELNFADVARTFLSADAILYKGAYREVLVDVFEERGILDRDEAGDYLRSLRFLPRIRLPQQINSAMASALFLEQDVLPSLSIPLSTNLIPLAAYRNSAGYAFLTYFNDRRETLEGEQFGPFAGVNIDLFGGLTLTFDPGGMLRSAIYRPVTAEDVRQVKVMTADLIQRGLITNQYFGPQVGEHGGPQGLAVSDESEPGKRRLVRFPAIFDSLPLSVRALPDYLRRMQGKGTLRD